ncbi:hypothetical protein, partial [Salmonella enterica]|uniref:hypothetical protein n=1 Tax=Salmonella enterica TaxID=28901 RepID=UPI003075AFA4
RRRTIFPLQAIKRRLCAIVMAGKAPSQHNFSFIEARCSMAACQHDSMSAWEHVSMSACQHVFLADITL